VVDFESVKFVIITTQHIHCSEFVTFCAEKTREHNTVSDVLLVSYLCAHRTEGWTS